MISTTGTPNKRQPRRRPRAKSNLGWLKSLTSHIDLGAKKDGHPIHLTSNDEIERTYRHFKDTGIWRHYQGWSKKRLAEHEANVETYYFTGSGDKEPETLVMLDLDCHDPGCRIEDAVSFCEYLRTNLWPDLYWEPSPRGVHAFFILDKQGLGAKPVKQVLLWQLLPHLRKLAEGYAFDLDQIKGLPPVLEWDNDGALKYTSGTLATLPRNLTSCRTTQRVNIFDLMKYESVRTSKIERSETVVVGSTSRRSQIESYRSVARQLLEQVSATTYKTRHKVTADDIAIALCALKVCSNNMNANGTLPQARIQALWNVWFKLGHCDRAFQYGRFKIIRDTMSRLGLIEWQDATYTLGRAAKWNLTADVISTLRVLERERGNPLAAQLTFNEHDETIVPIKTLQVPIVNWSPDEITRKVGHFLEIAA